MKKYFFYIILVCGILSCSDTEDPTFIMESTGDFNVVAGLNTLETHFFIIKDIPTFFESQSGIIGSDTSLIEAIYPRRASLSTLFENIDLDYINSIEVDMLDPADQSSRINMFYMEFIELGDKTTIRLFNSNNDLKKYMTQDLINIEVELTFRATSFLSQDFRLEMDFAVFQKQ